MYKHTYVCIYILTQSLTHMQTHTQTQCIHIYMPACCSATPEPYPYRNTLWTRYEHTYICLLVALQLQIRVRREKGFHPVIWQLQIRHLLCWVAQGTYTHIHVNARTHTRTHTHTHTPTHTHTHTHYPILTRPPSSPGRQAATPEAHHAPPAANPTPWGTH